VGTVEYSGKPGTGKTGSSVTLVPETQPGNSFSASVDYLNPFSAKAANLIGTGVFQ
jgi:hypothetical protein